MIAIGDLDDDCAYAWKRCGGAQRGARILIAAAPLCELPCHSTHNPHLAIALYRGQRRGTTLAAANIELHDLNVSQRSGDPSDIKIIARYAERANLSVSNPMF